MENEEFITYRLMQSSPDKVFEWLKSNRPDKETSPEFDREDLEKKLLERDDPIINLGLALYGAESNTGPHLFNKEDKIIKKAVLSGTNISSWPSSWIKENGILEALIDPFDEYLLSALFANERMYDGILTDLYERKEPYAKLPDDKWLTLIGYTASNKRINTPYDDSWMDGWSEYSYGRVFTSAWKLFETLPVNERTASIIAHLGENLVPDGPHDMDVLETIKRWDIKSESEYFNDYEWCRYHLAGLIRDYSDDFQKLKDSEDPALRKSYYSRFRPHKPEEVRELFEKDQDEFLDSAIHNRKLYPNEKIRDELRKCCWDYKHPHHEPDYPNFYNSMERHMQREHPEWFTDFEDDIPLEDIDDPMERANKQIDQINRKLNTLIEKVSTFIDRER
jgi:hypothetical protein